MSAKNKELNIRLHSIEELEYKAPLKGVKIEDVEDMGVALHIRAENKILSLLIEVVYIKQGTEILSKLKVKFNFEVEQFSNIIHVVDKDSILFKVDIMPDLFRMSMDMMRGIYYEKLKNTALKEHIIPIVDTQKMLGTINKDQKEKAQEEKEG